MSARHINIIKTRTHQWSYESGAGDDKAKSTVVYQDKRDGWAERCPKYESAHPDLGESFVLTKIRANGDEGDLINVTLEYEAADYEVTYPGRDPLEEATARYYVSPSGREEHILTHKYFEELNPDEREALMYLSNNTETDDKGVPWTSKLTSELAFTAYGMILKGIVSYRTGGITYTERKLIKSLTELKVAAMYTRNMPPGPAEGTVANWLFLGATATPSEDGKTWEAEFSWDWSKDGWDNRLYAPAT